MGLIKKAGTTRKNAKDCSDLNGHGGDSGTRWKERKGVAILERPTMEG